MIELFVASRLLIVLVAGLSLLIIKQGGEFARPTAMIDWFFRWDAAWYVDVAENGYHFLRDGEPSNVVFLPLFPALIRVVMAGGLVPAKIAGYVVANGCLLGAAAWLGRLVRLEGGDRATARLVLTGLFFGPVSFFFSTVYSESLFLMLSIGALCLAREQRWWWAGVLGALVATTRFIGFVMVVPLLWEMVKRRAEKGGPWRWADLWFLAPAFLPLVGVAAYGGLMWVEFGDPLMYFRGQAYWGREFSWWWDFFARESFWGQTPFFRAWAIGVVVVTFAIISAGAWLRVRSTYLVMALVFGFIYLSSRMAEGLARYFSVVFPLYFITGLACRRWPKLTIPLVSCSSAMLALAVMLFVNGYWFT